jgi:hypothetical protein
MLGTSLYILLPTADEIIIHPAFGLFLAYILQMPYVYGVLLSVLIYRVAGLGCLLATLFVGGKPAYQTLHENVAKRFMRKS